MKHAILVRVAETAEAAGRVSHETRRGFLRTASNCGVVDSFNTLIDAAIEAPFDCFPQEISADNSASCKTTTPLPLSLLKLTFQLSPTTPRFVPALALTGVKPSRLVGTADFAPCLHLLSPDLFRPLNQLTRPSDLILIDRLPQSHPTTIMLAERQQPSALLESIAEFEQFLITFNPSSGNPNNAISFGFPIGIAATSHDRLIERSIF